MAIHLHHESMPLSHSQIGGRFQRRAANAADYGGAVAANQWVAYFAGAIGTVKRFRGRRRGFFSVSHVCQSGFSESGFRKSKFEHAKLANVA
jgi:hypothetical protein